MNRSTVRAASTCEGSATRGAAVGSISYLRLLPMGLYEPPWRDAPRELALDPSYHLVHGAGVAAGYRLLEP